MTIISSDFQKILLPKNCKNERNRLLVKEVFIGLISSKNKNKLPLITFLIVLNEAEKNKVSFDQSKEEELEKLPHVLGEFFELTVDQKLKLK